MHQSCYPDRLLVHRARSHVTQLFDASGHIPFCILNYCCKNIKACWLNYVFFFLSRQLHTPTNILLLSLAVSDFLIGLLLMPAEIFLTTNCWSFGDVLCSLYFYMLFIINSASVGHMMLISVDRYVAVCYSLHYPISVTERRVKICACLYWLYCAFYGGLSLRDNLTQPGKYNSCYGECMIFIDDITGKVDLVISFIIPITVIVILYMRIFVVAVSQAHAMRSHIAVVTHQHSVTLTARRSELKAATTLGVLIVVFLICFCPFYCISFAGTVILDTPSTYFAYYLFYLNSCINPVIYALFYPWFRKAAKLIVTLQILQVGSNEAKIL